MIDVGIHGNDILVVDTSIASGHKRNVVAAIDGMLQVNKIVHRNGRVYLAPANPEYS